MSALSWAEAPPAANARAIAALDNFIVFVSLLYLEVVTSEYAVALRSCVRALSLMGSGMLHVVAKTTTDFDFIFDRQMLPGFLEIS